MTLYFFAGLVAGLTIGAFAERLRNARKIRRVTGDLKQHTERLEEAIEKASRLPD